jgi:Domain of unknown function (DUF4349)
LSPDLTAALREETPAAPERLRERVTLIAATPPPAPRRIFPFRRALLWAAPAAAAGSLTVAVVAGVITSSTPPAPLVQPPALESREHSRPAQGGDPGQVNPVYGDTQENSLQRAGPSVPAPSPNRATDVQADLRILVDDPDDLSAATQRALRTTRRLGGYLVTVDYGTPEPTEGAADLRARIPVSRVQAAIVSFSGLGRILSQNTQITDLQQRLDELTRQIRRTKDKERIAALRRERTELNRRAAYATVDLALTTHEPEQKAAPPSRLERALDDAAGVLAAELAIAAYILIVASPFLFLLGAALVASRAYRRYADQRLLERA